MAGYHKYVFNAPKRHFVGKFEDMYRSEDVEGFDSWHERDVRPIRKTIPLVLLNQYNFNRILEIGCGKGTFTQFLKKINNQVIALDISKTAISKAEKSYPDITFKTFYIAKGNLLELTSEGLFDLVVVMGTFAYIESWTEVLKNISKITRYFFVA